MPLCVLTQPLCPCRNILSLTNEFDFPDQSISRDDYASVLTHLNATQPESVARLHLESCHLQDFLDKVLRGLALQQTADWGRGHHWLWQELAGCPRGPVQQAGVGSQEGGPPDGALIGV